MIEILDMKDVKDATPEELEELRRKGFLPKTRSKRISGKPLTPYERTRAQVAATGIDGRWRTSTPHTAERRYSWECIIRTILLALVLKDGQNVRLRKG